MFFTNSLLYDLTGILVALVAVFLAYAKWSLGYWKRKGLKGPKPVIPFGNTLAVILGKTSFGENLTDIYFDLKSKGLRHGGVYFFLKPQYIPVDLEIVKAVFQTDFNNFASHGFYVNEKHDPQSAHLFSLQGQKWKDLRSKFTPTFSTAKMKGMFNILLECSENLNKFLEISVKNGPVEIKDKIARFTTDTIGCCAFGLDCNSMNDPKSEFRKHGAKVFDKNLVETVRWLAPFFLPFWVLDAIKLHAMNPEAGAFFRKMVYETVKFREENNFVRQDFLHMMIQLKNRGRLNDDNKLTDENINDGATKLTLDEISAQCFVFFLAGFETSSTAAHFGVFELALHPEMQERARKEINEVLKKYDNKITYEAVLEMNYLDLIVFETLRKYPTSAILPRICTKTYKVPGTDVVIDKGTHVVLPVLGIQMDPEYWPNPEKFDPERHTPEKKSSRPAFTWMPFGEGPRNCLGMRFGMLQTKVALITILKNYKFTLNKKTKLPMKFCKGGFTLTPDGPVLIDMQKI